jgi:pyrimidine-nucleoside phosphorylase
MRAVDLIAHKRDGGAFDEAQVRFLVQGFTAGEIPDYQFSSLLMAIVLRGMTSTETASLTRCMIESGATIDLAGVPGPLVDKHSTGGVGDKISLVLAPLAAACGLRVPMMSGRSLGHTGGTLDKLESIPGYRTDLAPDRFRQCLREVGFSMIGQSEDIVPADRRMYALRDVTGTVESIPLITASIMSKKFAEGAEGLVFDVKCGAGAFMRTPELARALAQSLVATGKGLGRRVVAVITDMDQPLGRTVGNFLEVEECVECLRGAGPAEEVALTCRLAGWMLKIGGLAATAEEGEAIARRRLADGSAWERFLRNVAFQGGDVAAVKDPRRGPHAAIVTPVKARAAGRVARIDARGIGIASVVLGAGRSRKEDVVRPGVGIRFLRRAGDTVREGDELCTVHGDVEAKVAEACAMVEAAFVLGPEPSPGPGRVLEEIV